MAIKVGGGGPHMPSFIVGLILGIALTIAYYHYTAAPAAPAIPAAEIRTPG